MSDMVSNTKKKPRRTSGGWGVEYPPQNGEVAVAQQLTEGALGPAWRLKGQPPPPVAARTVPLLLRSA